MSAGGGYAVGLKPFGRESAPTGQVVRKAKKRLGRRRLPGEPGDGLMKTGGYGNRAPWTRLTDKPRRLVNRPVIKPVKALFDAGSMIHSRGAGEQTEGVMDDWPLAPFQPTRYFDVDVVERNLDHHSGSRRGKAPMTEVDFHSRYRVVRRTEKSPADLAGHVGSAETILADPPTDVAALRRVGHQRIPRVTAVR